ncbi:MAG: cation transporter [Bacteroidetes bacterium]|nr:cation transporter [Bacteroidota bacterium]
MKIKVLAIALVCLAALHLPLSAQQAAQKESKFETVSIQTSAVCGMCKERLEKNLALERGVRAVSLDNETKIITIEYRKGRNSKEGLKKAITKIGYDADEMPADKKAHDRLPACCQKGNEPH